LKSKQVQGFKETKIGSIPYDWELVELGEVSRVIDPRPSHRAPVEILNGFPYVGIRDVTENGIINVNSCRKVGEDAIKQQEKLFKIDDNPIGFGRNGTVGRIVKFKKKDFRYAISPHFALIIPTSRINKKFLYFAIRDKQFLQHAFSFITGTTRPTIGIQDLRKTLIVLPSLDEQIQIGSILFTIDTQIENLQNQNKILEQITQTMFTSWFMDFDGITEFEDSELGKIPKGWKINQLDNIAIFLNGLPLQKFRPNNDSFLPVIKIREMKNGITNNTEKARIDIEEKYIVNEGDVLFSWSGTLELMIWTLRKGALNQHIFKVTSENYEKWFYYMWVKFHLDEFRRIAEGKVTTMGHIQRHHLSEALVLIPSAEILKNMTHVMNPIFEKFIQNKTFIQTLTQTRDVLIPKLMSGEIKYDSF